MGLRVGGATYKIILVGLFLDVVIVVLFFGAKALTLFECSCKRVKENNAKSYDVSIRYSTLRSCLGDTRSSQGLSLTIKKHKLYARGVTYIRIKFPMV